MSVKGAALSPQERLLVGYSRQTTEDDRESRRGWAKRLKAEQEAALAAGWHPATGRPVRPELGTCGDCESFLRHLNRYFKCTRVSWTHGQKTDIRKRWPACELFVAAEQGEGE